MFTQDQIYKALEKVKSGADFPQFVQDLKQMGVTHYDNFVSDGRTTYFGHHGVALNGAPKYPNLEVNNTSSSTGLKHAISIHQQGQTDYLTFCRQAAEAGVEKWTTHMMAMTVTYLDKKGQILTVEPIRQP